MFCAKLKEAKIFKNIVEALKDFVKEINIEANSSGLYMQAMDSNHVALATFDLHESGFMDFRCDHNINLGISIHTFAKVLKCANNDDSICL